MSRKQLGTLLLIGGVESNPGPTIEEAIAYWNSIKGHKSKAEMKKHVELTLVELIKCESSTKAKKFKNFLDDKL